jgi:hypothetical protein
MRTSVKMDYLGRDFDRGPADYDREVLTAGPLHSVSGRP